jgi:hypothetical protein
LTLENSSAPSTFPYLLKQSLKWANFALSSE